MYGVPCLPGVLYLLCEGVFNSGPQRNQDSFFFFWFMAVGKLLGATKTQFFQSMFKGVSVKAHSDDICEETVKRILGNVVTLNAPTPCSYHLWPECLLFNTQLVFARENKLCIHCTSADNYHPQYQWGGCQWCATWCDEIILALNLSDGIKYHTFETYAIKKQ